MNEKKIEPTDAMVEAGASYAWEEANPGILGWNSISERHKEGCRRDARAVLTAALNHPDAAGLFECDHTDYVHVDEAARRVEAAHGRGWDGAAEFLGKIGFRHLIPDLRAANPYRPASALPTEDGAVIVPSEGRKFIRAEGGRYFARLTYSSQLRLWYGIEASGGPAWAAVWYGEPEKITPGTWKVDDQ